MRKQDMEVGRAYRLHGFRETKVTMLETPEQLRGKARVKVRFETGIKQGQVSDVQSQRILGPWDGPAPEPPKPRSVPSRSIDIERPPEVGDQVLWEAETGPLAWTLDAIEGDVATVSGAIFGQPSSANVPVQQLRAAPIEQRPERSPSVPWMKLDSTPKPAPQKPEHPGPGRLAPERPRRELDVLLEDIVFERACSDQYKQRFLRGKPNADANEELRKDIRRHGYIDRTVPGQHGRLCVLNKFEIPLPHKPTAENPLSVSRLQFAERSPGKRNRGRRDAA